jgi:hypothetical protein
VNSCQKIKEFNIYRKHKAIYKIAIYKYHIDCVPHFLFVHLKLIYKWNIELTGSVSVWACLVEYLSQIVKASVKFIEIRVWKSILWSVLGNIAECIKMSRILKIIPRNLLILGTNRTSGFILRITTLTIQSTNHNYNNSFKWTKCKILKYTLCITFIWQNPTEFFLFFLFSSQIWTRNKLIEYKA